MKLGRHEGGAQLYSTVMRDNTSSWERNNQKEVREKEGYLSEEVYTFEGYKTDKEAERLERSI